VCQRFQLTVILWGHQGDHVSVMLYNLIQLGPETHAKVPYSPRGVVKKIKGQYLYKFKSSSEY
jgi:hypothetical protein